MYTKINLTYVNNNSHKIKPNKQFTLFGFMGKIKLLTIVDNWHATVDK
jgi:hypothetical protein